MNTIQSIQQFVNNVKNINDVASLQRHMERVYHAQQGKYVEEHFKQFLTQTCELSEEEAENAYLSTEYETFTFRVLEGTNPENEEQDIYVTFTLDVTNYSSDEHDYDATEWTLEEDYREEEYK